MGAVDCMGSVDWGMVGALSGIAALVLTTYTHLVSRADRLRRDFESVDRRAYWARQLKVRGGWRQRYKAALEARKNGWDTFFGGPTLSLPSFGFYLMVATVYPIVLVMLTYLISGQADFAGIPLMPEAATILQRFWWVAVPASTVITGALVLSILQDWMWQPSGWKKRLGLAVYLLPLPALYFGTPAMMSLGYGAPIAAVALAPFWFVLFTTLSAIVWFGSFSFFAKRDAPQLPENMTFFMLGLSITAQFALAYGLGWISPAMLLFFVLLPIINALMDAISWSVTRAFVDSAAKRGTTWLVLIEAILDFAFALLCLVVLTALIANVVALSDLWFGDSLEVTFSVLLERSVMDPFGDGLVVTGMLVTTFIPTCIHLWDGLRGLFATPLAGMHEVGTALEAVEDGKDVLPDLEDRAISAIRVYNLRLLIWGVLAVIVLTMLGVFVLWGVPGFTAFLAIVAQCATTWHGQACIYWP